MALPEPPPFRTGPADWRKIGSGLPEGWDLFAATQAYARDPVLRQIFERLRLHAEQLTARARLSMTSWRRGRWASRTGDLSS
jgi:hypothetical protein